MAISSSIHGFPGGEWLLTGAVKADRPQRWKPQAGHLALLGFTGSWATLGYAVLKLAYYWPILQAKLSVLSLGG